MLSKSQIKLINSLSQKKYRQRQELFMAEGKKTISELLSSRFSLHSLYTTEALFEVEAGKQVIIDEKELKKISQLTTPQTAVALFHFPKPQEPREKGLKLALDGVRDPGNMGTIIRLCDWFGIQDLICSIDSVDCYNPKVVQATMGSIARVNVFYTSLPEYLSKQNQRQMVFGTFMDGKNIYRTAVAQEGEGLEQRQIIVMGNEANGISPEVEALVNERIAIPQFGEIRETESLNVAAATAILLSEFRRTGTAENH